MTAGLWAVTAYFNPRGYRSRRQNFDVFRRRLGVPLLVVEHAPEGAFALSEADADILVRIPGESVLWQKERLLNLALARLPAEARLVAWLDCDVVFADSGWPRRLAECLGRVPMAQCFSRVLDLDRGETPEDHQPAPLRPFVPSVARLIAEGRWPDPCWRAPPDGVARRVGYGFAWAAHRDILERHGFYDAMIIGAGDRAMICAAMGCFEEHFGALRHDPARVAHYLAWAQPFHRTVAGRLGAVEGGLYHLWHGDMADRRYTARQHDLAGAGFDPARHIRPGASGAWEWTEDAPAELRDVLARFFTLRHEDD